MKTVYSATIVSSDPSPTVAEILDAIKELAAQPRLAGSLMGMPVYVSGSIPDQVLEIRGAHQTVRFRLDHPLIKGTKIERALREDS